MSHAWRADVQRGAVVPAPSARVSPPVGAILESAFYRRPTLDVARALLGKVFVRRAGGETLAGRIVEVEAYAHSGDEASHSRRGRTARNAVMFAPGGVLYVYFTYGMHYCMNVVTEDEGVGAAVLIRAIEPLAGLEVLRRNRGGVQDVRALCSGPAKCCQAFGITAAQNGASLVSAALHILDAPAVDESRVVYAPRIGIRRSADLPWRMFETDNPFVSRHPRAVSSHADFHGSATRKG